MTPLSEFTTPGEISARIAELESMLAAIDEQLRDPAWATEHGLTVGEALGWKHRARDARSRAVQQLVAARAKLHHTQADEKREVLKLRVENARLRREIAALRGDLDG